MTVDWAHYEFLATVSAIHYQPRQGIKPRIDMGCDCCPPPLSGNNLFRTIHRTANLVHYCLAGCTLINSAFSNMKPRILKLCFGDCCLLAHFGVCAQNNSPVPFENCRTWPWLYLDSAFDGLQAIPVFRRYFLNGLEFYNGVMAIDCYKKKA